MEVKKIKENVIVNIKEVKEFIKEMIIKEVN